ncbi:MAG: ornithine carbamoyltransferase [Anaerolineae bacterium]|nr:ornithine carbamoyltransferase [Anaerolineae bacterium]
MKHFLDLSDWSSQELHHLIQLAAHLKFEWKSGGNKPVLGGKTLGMIFQKPSLRTRVSFDVGMQHLGGHSIMLGPSEIGLGKRESIADVARVLSSMVQGIMARVFEHQHVLELAKWSSVPVINGLSDDRHPCQAMADMLTIYEHFGHTEGLQLAYIGDGNNVAASLALICANFGVDFTIASPEGYELPDATVELAQQAGAITIRRLRDPLEAVQGANILYTDTWVSMGQEEESAERVQAFKKYQIDTELVASASPDAVVMHDLPAYRGKEITDEVADGPQSVIFQQAENRLHAQKAILVHLMS